MGSAGILNSYPSRAYNAAALLTFTLRLTFFFFSKMPHLNADRLVGIVNVFDM